MAFSLFGIVQVVDSTVDQTLYDDVQIPQPTRVSYNNAKIITGIIYYYANIVSMTTSTYSHNEQREQK